MPPEDKSQRILAGGCRCGSVRYAVADEFIYAANCHCSGCRAVTGSAFKPIARIARTKLTITSGFEYIDQAGEDESNNDMRCTTCGSFLFSIVRDGEFVEVAMGSLTDTPTIRPTHHIFVGSKAAWFEITDDLPQFDEYPP